MPKALPCSSGSRLGPFRSLCVPDRKCLLSVCRHSARFAMDMLDDLYRKKVSQGISLNTVSS